MLYGPGGIGKTTFAATASGPVAFFDVDNSLPKLKVGLAESGLGLDIRSVPFETWQDIRDALHSPGWDDIKTIVIDSATVSEERAITHVLKHVPHEKQGVVVSGIEGYGYGKGYTHVYDEFSRLLADLETHTRAGRNAILICHDCIHEVPNPNGEDFLRYEPRMQDPKSGKASIRLRIKEWADHVLFFGYDIAVDEHGKGVGAGTRSIYTYELPWCMAKSRSIAEIVPVEKFDQTLWTELLK